MIFYIRVAVISIVLAFLVLAGLLYVNAEAHWPYSTTRVAQDLQFATNFDGMCGGGDEGCDQQSISAWPGSPARVGDHSYSFGGQWREVDYAQGWGTCRVHVRVFGHWEGRFNIGEVYATTVVGGPVECHDGPT